MFYENKTNVIFGGNSMSGDSGTRKDKENVKILTERGRSSWIDSGIWEENMHVQSCERQSLGQCLSTFGCPLKINFTCHQKSF